MKKRILIFLLITLLLTSSFSEEIDLYSDWDSRYQFSSLTAEEQYYSVINSFKKNPGINMVPHFVSQMIRLHGREIIPYLNKTLIETDFDYAKTDYTLDIVSSIFENLISNDLLTENERQLYIIITKGKIKEYILKYRVLDGSINLGYSLLDSLHYSWSEDEYFDPEILKTYWEKELGITGIVAGNIDSVFDITPSPLAEYITD